MKVLEQKQIDAFRSFIEGHETFIIVGHKEPDGDCVSSCIGVSYILEHFSKPYVMLNAGPFKRSDIRRFAPLFTNSLPFMSQKDRDVTGLIILDCSELSRLGEIDGDLKGFDTFIVDHHRTASAEGENNIIDPSAAAASCLVVQLFEALVGKPTAEQANAMFFGMATDTGFFRFLDEKNASEFACASRLTEYGANPRQIYQDMTGGKSWNTRKLLGIMLDRAERHFNGKLVVTWETMEDTRRYGQDGRDSDALYSLMLEVDGVEAVLFLRQDTEHTCTAGFRSRTNCDVSAIAAKFGGGGHKNAAGTSVEGRLETVMPAILKEFAKVL